MDTTSTRIRYAALSYCWGSSLEATYRTTSQNLEARKAGFSDAELPKTIRDAIVVTRRLGIGFLWVDALCILQGDDSDAKDDWAKESAKMRSVYGGALLTIAASSGPSASSGIFDLSRPQPNRSAVGTTFVSRNRSFPSGSVFLSQPEALKARHEPLYQRGWTLQERILSPRILFFTRGQSLWECESTILSQSGNKMESLSSLRLPNHCSLHILQKRWKEIVMDYSCRNLSFPKDKLPALSGLARAYNARRPNDRYLAGLWGLSLCDDLLWKRHGTGYGHGLSAVPPDYRAPSWSWASVDGSVSWDLRPYEESRELKPPEYQAKILSARVQPKGTDQFGELAGGAIIMEAPLVEMVRSGEVLMGAGPPDWRVICFLDYPHALTDELDDKKQLSKLWDAYLLRITTFHALIVVPADGTPLTPGNHRRYKRVGFGSLPSSSSMVKPSSWKFSVVEII
jgi:hypothetical protein